MRYELVLHVELDEALWARTFGMKAEEVRHDIADCAESALHGAIRTLLGDKVPVRVLAFTAEVKP